MTRPVGAGGAPLTAVVAALAEEAAPLRSRLSGAWTVRAGVSIVTMGELGGVPVVVATTGDGEHNARTGIAALLTVYPVKRVIAIGIAGAVTPGLDVGARIVGERVHAPDGGAALTADPALVRWAVGLGAGRSGVIVSAGQLIDTPRERWRLRRRLDSFAKPAVTDLETATYARAAASAGIPWLAIRSVSDTVDETLPQLLNRSRDAGGAIRRSAVLRGALFEPSAIWPLMRLRARLGRCARELADTVAALLAAWPEPATPSEETPSEETPSEETPSEGTPEAARARP